MRLELRKTVVPGGHEPRVARAPAKASARAPGLDAIRRGPLAALTLPKVRLPAWLQGVRGAVTAGAAAAMLGATLLLAPGVPVGEVAAPSTEVGVDSVAVGPVLPPPVDTVTQADPRVALEAVRSLAVEQAREAVSGAHRQLGKAQARRMAALEGMLANMQTNGASEGAIQQVQEDLHRPLEAVATTPDSRWVHPGLQADVAAAFGVVEGRGKELLHAFDAFSRLDEAYLAAPVAEVLAPLGLRPADLKALVAQESGDHLLKDPHGDIAGIAQIGTREVREVAPHLDRHDDAQAIELAARVLVKKAEQLEAMAEARGVDFTAVRDGPDYHRFLFAAYNAGAAPIARAIAIAKDAGVDHTSWSAVLGGDGVASSLHAGLRATPTYGRKAAAKLDEVTTYVERIDARRPALPLDVMS